MKWEKVIKWPLLKSNQITVKKTNEGGLVLANSPGVVEEILDNHCGAENWACDLDSNKTVIAIRHPEGTWINKAGTNMASAAHKWGIGRELYSVSIKDMQIDLSKQKWPFSIKKIIYKNRKITELCIVDADNFLVFDLNLHNSINLTKKEITALMNFTISMHGDAAKVVMKTILSKLGKRQMSEVSKKEYSKFEGMIYSYKPEDIPSE